MSKLALSRLTRSLSAMHGNTNAIEFLLKFDPDAASKEVTGGTRCLPLHSACKRSDLSTVQLLYDAYPEAILISDEDGNTPVDIAQRNGNQPVMEFLQTQLVYARQAQDMTAMTTVDENGQLLLHRSLKDNASLKKVLHLVRLSYWSEGTGLLFR